MLCYVILWISVLQMIVMYTFCAFNFVQNILIFLERNGLKNVGHKTQGSCYSLNTPRILVSVFKGDWKTLKIRISAKTP